MNVMVTGGAGFIGSNLVYYLLHHRPNWKIVVVDNPSYSGNYSNISSLVSQNKIALEKVDISNKEEITNVFAKYSFDYIFHLAAESHVDRSILGAEAFVKTNVLGTQNILDCMLVARATNRGSKTTPSRLIHISTDEVYGSLGATGCFYEDTPLNPSSPYSASKAASDLLVLAAKHTHSLDVVVTRCTNNYGYYQFPEKFIPLLITNALEDKELPLYGDGLNIRSWLYVDDHCDALLRVAEGGRSGEIYNVGGSTEAELANIDVAVHILQILNKERALIKRVADRLGHDRRYAVSYKKIETELGWKPTVDFVSGLERTVKWYVENQQWWKDIKQGDYLNFYQSNYGSRIVANGA